MINYDTDIAKHYVRKEGWLDACRNQYNYVSTQINRKRRKQPFTYFTFCAVSAVDVFMLEMSHLLKRDNISGRLENVYFCEKDKRQFQKIEGLFGRNEAGFLGDFAKIVLFQDDDETRGKEDWVVDDEEAVPNDTTRTKFRYKKANQRFKELFPLDVINFDPFGPFFPADEEIYSNMLQSMRKMFEWQNKEAKDGHKCDTFTLIVTTHIEETRYNQNAISEMVEAASTNIANHAEFKKAFQHRHNHVDPQRFRQDNFRDFFCVIFPKVIAPFAKECGWFGSHSEIYVYTDQNRANYHMMSYAVTYERIQKDTSHFPRLLDIKPDEVERYVAEVSRILTTQPTDVNLILANNLQKRHEIQQDLESVTNYRKDFLASQLVDKC